MSRTTSGCVSKPYSLNKINSVQHECKGQREKYCSSIMTEQIELIEESNNVLNWVPNGEGSMAGVLRIAIWNTTPKKKHKYMNKAKYRGDNKLLQLKISLQHNKSKTRGGAC